MKLMSSNVIWVCGNGVNAAVRVLHLNARLKGLYLGGGSNMIKKGFHI